MTSKIFTDADAVAIIMSDEPAREMAARLKVSVSLIQAIRRGVRWGHVDGPGVKERVARFQARPRRGDGYWHSKLTTEKVLAIRSDNRSQSLLARVHGVSASTIAEIKHRKIWTHI